MKDYAIVIIKRNHQISIHYLFRADKRRLSKSIFIVLVYIFLNPDQLVSIFYLTFPLSQSHVLYNFNAVFSALMFVYVVLIG